MKEILIGLGIMYLTINLMVYIVEIKKILQFKKFEFKDLPKIIIMLPMILLVGSIANLVIVYREEE